MVSRICISALLIVTFTSLAQNNIIGIKKALQIALQYNLEIKSYSYKLDQGLQDIEQAKIRPNPIFNTQILFLKEQHYYPEYPLITSQFNRQDWYQLTKKYQLFGQRKNNIQLSYSQNRSLNFTFEDVKRQLLNAVANKWLDAWHAQIQMNLAKNAVSSLDTLLEKSKPTKEKEMPNEYLRLLILDDEYDMGEINATQELNNQLRTLEFMVQKDSINGIDTSNFALSQKAYTDLNSCIVYAIKNRPDLLSALEEINSAQINVKLQQSLAWPAPEAGPVFNPQNKIPYLGFFLNQPLPLFDHNQTKIVKSKIQVDFQNNETKLLEQKIINEVKIAHSTLTVQMQKLEKMIKAVHNANILLSQVRLKYTKNNTVYVDLWEAESTWYDTQLLYYKTEYEYRKSFFDLLFVTGHLLNWLE